jgi:hypothetical protein
MESKRTLSWLDRVTHMRVDINARLPKFPSAIVPVADLGLSQWPPDHAGIPWAFRKTRT